jgi:sugar phosphate isomerase/epimerase
MSRAGNYLRGTIVGHGNVPILQCVSILKRAHYTGWYSIEFEGMEDCLTALRIGLKNLRNDLEA